MKNGISFDLFQSNFNWLDIVEKDVDIVEKDSKFGQFKMDSFYTTNIRWSLLYKYCTITTLYYIKYNLFGQIDCTF